MKHAIWLCAGLVAASCGLIKVELKNKTVKTKTLTSTNTLGGGCIDSNKVYGDGLSVNLNDFDGVKTVGSVACIANLDLAITASVSALGTSTQANETCTGGPKGTLTDTVYNLSYKKADGAEEKLAVACDKAIALTSASDVQAKLQKCLDDNKSAINTFAQKGLNSSEKTFTLKVGGACTSDACFSISYQFTAVVSGTVQAGGC